MSAGKAEKLKQIKQYYTRKLGGIDQTAICRKSLVYEEVSSIFNKLYPCISEKNKVKILVKHIKDGGCVVVVDNIF